MSPFTPARPVRFWNWFRKLIHATLAVLVLAVSNGATKFAEPSAGERLYREGVLPSNRPLKGDRAAAGSIEGKEAACVNCHRPSGLGSMEGSIVVPPVTAKYLFRPRNRQTAQGHTEHSVAVLPERNAYTVATLTRAIREGIGPDGHELDYLMPRYRIDDKTMESLIIYLKGLSSGMVPGLIGDTLHLATIVTPDSDPAKRRGMLNVLEHFIAWQNTVALDRAPILQGSSLGHFHTTLRWQLHVWELAGDSSTWKFQLHKRLSREPVFAVISGIGRKTWEPVHSFCEEESIPCLLPNVELPVVKESDLYDIYFSRGVLLEADLIAHQLGEQTANSARGRITQIYRSDDIGVEAARELREKAEAKGFRTVDHALEPGDSVQLAAGFLEHAAPQDALVLWLRQADLKDLPSEKELRPWLYVSGLMGGLENSPLPGTWRKKARMTYPFELPLRRGAFMDYPLGWFRFEHIPVVAEETQIETYVACRILAEILGNMHDDIGRDYLIESLESMLDSRIINGYYYRLGLAPGQRFASKGGYVVRFAGPSGTALQPEGDWIVP